MSAECEIAATTEGLTLEQAARIQKVDVRALLLRFLLSDHCLLGNTCVSDSNGGCQVHRSR